MDYKWTLYRKIQWLIILVLFTVFIFSNFAIANLINKDIKDTFLDNTENTSILIQKNIETLFGDALTIIEQMKTKLNNTKRDDEYASEYLGFVSKSVNSVTNTFMAYNDGTYVLRPFAAIPANFDPREREWYKLGYKMTGVKWSDPYIDVSTKKLVITGVTYINQIDTDGVFGLDLDLSRLNDNIAGSKISKNGFILLVNDEGTIISDSRNTLNNKDIVELNDSEFTSSGIITGSIETDKGVYYLRLLNRTNIRLIAFLPHSDLGDAKRRIQLYLSLTLFIVLFIALVITHIVIGRITKPLEELKNTMIASSSGGLIRIYEGKTNDEINSLIEGYNRMATNVNEQNEKIQLVTKELIESDHKLHDQYVKTAELAYSDHLTGLPNRFKFEEVANEMIEERERFALFYIDLDNFKVINDTYGHSHGDKVLEVISRRFDDYCDQKCFFARLSGDEFGVLVPIKWDKAEVKENAEEMLHIICEPIKYKNLEFEITGSIGISIFPDDSESFESILSNADIAMFEAKDKSKNQFVIYNNQLKLDLMHKFNLESKLLQSLDNNEMHVYYQALIDYKTKEINGFEALVRWIDPVVGMIFPDDFIPIAEHNLYINKIGEFVLEESVKFGTELKREYGKYYMMNVNVSAVQLHLESFIDDVIQVLKKYDYPAGFLNLEITESVAIEKDKSIIKKLSMLHKIGIKISLDDFGTGYSSLNHLLNLSLTDLKIDRSLIVEAVKKDEVYRLIKGIVDFAHTIHLKVVAEGIEDVYMEQMVGHMGVDICQGYLYTKAVEKNKVKAFIDNHPNKA